MAVNGEFDQSILPEPMLDPMSVAEFFKDKSVFITGVTGFMGKVLLEKLLWSCEEIGNIYILIRHKKDVHPLKRVEEMLQLPIFDRLRKRNCNSLLKIIPICGDVNEVNLGISDEDRITIEDSVSIIIHAAASVRFDDPLKKAVLNNVRAVKEVMELAKKTKKLKVMAYISTSYCNCDKSIIEEKVIPSNYDWRTILKLVENEDEHTLNIIQPKILDERPNTYTFTKSLAENVVFDYSKEIPCIIIRPSIVVYTMYEPFPGWIDNLNGPIGLSVGGATGFLHALYGDKKCIGDYMPCDLAINGIIVATWYKGISNRKECEVVNGAGGSKKAVNLVAMENAMKEVLEKCPISTMIWYPSLIVTKNKYFFYFLVLLTHVLPGLLLDSISKIIGVKRNLMRMYRKVFRANLALSYFMTREWKILTHKYDQMASFMSNNDKKTFLYDLKDLDEREGMYVGAYAMKKFIFKEDMSESAQKLSLKYLKIRYWVHQATKNIFYVTVLWIIIKNLFGFLLSYLQ